MLSMSPLLWFLPNSKHQCLHSKQLYSCPVWKTCLLLVLIFSISMNNSLVNVSRWPNSPTNVMMMTSSTSWKSVVILWVSLNTWTTPTIPNRSFTIFFRRLLSTKQLICHEPTHMLITLVVLIRQAGEVIVRTQRTQKQGRSKPTLIFLRLSSEEAAKHTVKRPPSGRLEAEIVLANSWGPAVRVAD